MKILSAIGIVILASGYIVFAILYPSAEKCPKCGLCISPMPINYYWDAYCAGTAISAYVFNRLWKNRIFETVVVWSLVILILDFAHRRLGIINGESRYPVLLITYTSALCIAYLILRYFLKYLTRTYS